MGSQQETTVVRNGEKQTYRLSVGGDSFENTVFWGLDEVMRRLEGCEVFDYLVYTGEGGGVVDFDRKVLLWYGGQSINYDLPLRRAFRTLARRQWPGWDERWAEHGPETVRAYLGEDDVDPVIPPDPEAGLGLVPADSSQIRAALPGIRTLLSYDFVLRYTLPTPEFTADVERKKDYLARIEQEFSVARKS